MKPRITLLQNVSTAETRALRLACLLGDVATANCSAEGLRAYSQDLRSGQALPVGSVEFVRAAMQAAGIKEPANISYPEGAQRHLGRVIHKTTAGQVLGRWFVKPLATKAFTGFVFDSLRGPAAYSESDQESLQGFLAMPADAPVWISEPVDFQSEWRYYVMDGQVIGSARYDPDGADDAPEPDARTVTLCIADVGISTPFAADFGVLSDGTTVLVEANDAWALGLYGKALEPSQYLAFLYERWRSLINNRINN